MLLRKQGRRKPQICQTNTDFPEHIASAATFPICADRCLYMWLQHILSVHLLLPSSFRRALGTGGTGQITCRFRPFWYNSNVSTKAQAVLQQIRALPIPEQHAVWRELGQSIGQLPASVSDELYGEPLTEEDIEQSARVAFQALDQEEKRAESR